MKLYFVTANRYEVCVMGGHWFADSADEAQQLALAAFTRDVPHEAPENMRLNHAERMAQLAAGQIWFRARVSKASRANACNPERAP